MIWHDIKNKQPIATETGGWDGYRTDLILVCTLSRHIYVAYMYEGVLNGHTYRNFYTKDDYEIENVAYWTEIDMP